jgi:general secretion pathway protein L
MKQDLAFVGGFFRWWRAELMALVPERLIRLSTRKGYIVLTLDGSGPLALAIENSRNPTTLGHIANSTGNEAREAVQAILARSEIRGGLARNEIGLCLRLPSRCALRQTIELPLAAESNLGEVVGFELDRYTPFRAEQVHYAHRVVARDTTAQRIAVEVTVVPRTVVDEGLERARELGFAPERVEVADPDPEARHSENLIARTAPLSHQGGGRLTYGLAIVAAILAVVAVTLPFEAAQRQAAEMTDEFAALHKKTQAVDVLQNELKALRSDESFLVDRKSQSPTLSKLLAETTRILPDETWLVEFRVHGPEVELAGVTQSASALIGLLEQSGLFKDTSFRSPVTPDPGSGRERFNIAAHIVGARAQ